MSKDSVGHNAAKPKDVSVLSAWSSLWIASVAAVVLVVSSGVGVIYSSYKSRQLFSELQQLNRETVRLEEEWGRLLLEQSTWASHARIEHLAKSELHMVVPKPESTIVVRQ